ncbi:MAG TPA: cbb3-type cytochrome c oxidase subunit 3 [Polyangiaceae bacterium]
MKLSDVVSAMHISVYAEIPLLIFMGVFIGVCVSLFRQGSKHEQMAELPLRSEHPSRSEP